MTQSNIHIVSFNIPYPPNYGGIIDVFYKIKSLYESGMKIHLHCFDYGRGVQPKLNKLCLDVHYYERKMGILKSTNKIPYIVNSRSNNKLLNNLLSDNYPILFEGLHSTYYLNHPSLKERIKIVRMHNIEHDYYQLLSQQENSIIKKIYYKIASIKLKKYESVLHHATHIASISNKDQKYFSHKYNKSFLLPPFHSNNSINVIMGSGNNVLYHGNLSVVENIKAVEFLINTFKKEKNISFIIAGKNPTKSLTNTIAKYKHIELIANPSDKEMLQLISNAHIHLLPTFQPTGIKLKLIASLFNGRHCVVNSQMVKGTGLEKLCHLADNSDEFVTITHKLMSLPFKDSDMVYRKKILNNLYNNKFNSELLQSYIQ